MKDVEAEVRGALADVAPEADLAALGAQRDVREGLDIDSFDFLNFVVGLHTRLGVEIPEADYARVRTVADACRYLEQRLAAAAPPAR